MFFSICIDKKNPEVILFLGILKNVSPRIKYIFVEARKAMFRLIEKLFLSLFHNAEPLLYYPQMSVFSFHTFFVLLYQSLKDRT